MDNTQEITLDIKDNHTYQQLYTKQYDYGSSIIFHIVNDGCPFDIEGVTAIFSLKKPDGHFIENNADVIDGGVKITITEQMTSVYGKANFSVTLLKNNVCITTITGVLKIDEAVIHPEDIESSDEYNIIDDILHKVTDANGAIKISENNAKKSAENAKSSEINAKASETNAMNHATQSQNHAQQSNTAASEASNKANEASSKAEEASAFATQAQNYANEASSSASDAALSSAAASASAAEAVTSKNVASDKASEASSKADEASKFAEQSQDYATGDTNSSKYYYEQIKNISESVTGALRPMGTVAFANLPELSIAVAGDMYNISDEFITTSDFNEGAGNIIPAGANVYKTSDGHWDILAGTPVTSVNGQRGNVTITSESIGISFDRIYPIGSIYMSVNNVNPQSFFGGTWVAWGAGRVPVGVSTLETEFETVEKTGGTTTVNLQHSHTVNNHTHGMSHSHTVDSHTHGMSHSHTVDNHTHGMSHSHTVDSHIHGMSHSHTVNSHKHLGTTGVDNNHYYQGATYGSTIINSSVENMTGLYFNPASESRTSIIRLSYTSPEAPGTNVGTRTTTDGATPGTDVGTKTTTDGAAPGTNTGTRTTTGGAAPGTNTGTRTTTDGTAPDTNTNLNTAQSILQPYITCYMWKRTA